MVLLPILVILFSIHVEAKPEQRISSQAGKLRNWGVSHTNADRAWSLTKGSRSVVVAVIDTGADTTHPALSSNIWINKGESGKDKNGRDKRTNGIDDDGNGYIDDVNGWNFVGNNNNLQDDHGHGTHISGIIGANGKGPKGVLGVSPRVNLMILKYFSPKSLGSDNIQNTIRAIDYAVKMGAQVINYSAGGLTKSQLERAAIYRAHLKGVLFVAAAGNEASNTDRSPYYPADYELPNILSVTAINRDERILSSSNYGSRTVDIAAPGDDILSTLPGGDYGLMTGTSQATAFVSGVAALILSQRSQSRGPEATIRSILNTGDFDPSLRGRTRSRAKLNSYRALVIKGRGEGVFGQVQERKDNLSSVMVLATDLKAHLKKSLEQN